jgi:hypothetical protein
MAFEGPVTLHRPRALVRAAAAAPLVFALVALVLALAGVITGGAVYPLIIDPAFLGLGLTLFALRRNPWPARVPARLEVDRDGVSLDGRKVLQRRAVRRGYVQPWSDRPPTVRLLGRAGRPLLEVEVADEEAGHALLDALELGVAHQATRFYGGSPLLATFARRMAFGLSTAALMLGGTFLAALLHPIFSLAPLLPVLFVLIPAGLVAFPASIHVGADGVFVSWLFYRRFYPFKDIAGVRAERRSVRLWLHSGEAVDVPVIARRSFERMRGFDKMRIAAVVARISAALDAARESKRPADVAALVARGGRRADEWSRAVRALLAGSGGDYRSNAVPEENLWRVAEDPTAEETARVGAAVALRTRLDDDGRARMLRVAEASVSPRIRVALQAAASAEEEALTEALAAYDAETMPLASGHQAP